VPSALEDLLKRRQAQLAQVQALGSQPSAAQTPMTSMGPPGAKSHAGLTGLLGAYTGGIVGSHVGNAISGMVSPSAPQVQSFSSIAPSKEGIGSAMPGGGPVTGNLGGSPLAPQKGGPQQNMLQRVLAYLRA